MKVKRNPGLRDLELLFVDIIRSGWEEARAGRSVRPRVGHTFGALQHLGQRNLAGRRGGGAIDDSSDYCHWAVGRGGTLILRQANAKPTLKHYFC